MSSPRPKKPHSMFANHDNTAAADKRKIWAQQEVSKIANDRGFLNSFFKKHSKGKHLLAPQVFSNQAIDDAANLLIELGLEPGSNTSSVSVRNHVAARLYMSEFEKPSLSKDSKHKF